MFASTGVGVSRCIEQLYAVPIVSLKYAAAGDKRSPGTLEFAIEPLGIVCSLGVDLNTVSLITQSLNINWILASVE